MNQRERMLSGLPYKAWLDGLEEDRQACKQKIYDFNQLPPSRQSKEVLEQGSIIERGDHEDLLAQHGRYYQLYTGQAELA